MNSRGILMLKTFKTIGEKERGETYNEKEIITDFNYCSFCDIDYGI